jgi:hypothetical protein
VHLMRAACCASEPSWDRCWLQLPGSLGIYLDSTVGPRVFARPDISQHDPRIYAEEGPRSARRNNGMAQIEHVGDMSSASGNW